MWLDNDMSNTATTAPTMAYIRRQRNYFIVVAADGRTSLINGRFGSAMDAESYTRRTYPNCVTVTW